jgi:methionine sulfoxide reductase heme-binding subunit
MPSPRLRRRLVRHHLVLALASSAATALLAWLVPSKDPTFRWSMATAYVGLALLGLSLATGPLNVVRRRPNPVSSDLRRDIGIWAGVLSLLHFVVGWQVHMKHRYLYWLREVKETGGLAVRTDLFGFANHTGLVAVLIAALLLALSNDRSLRALGTPRWKGLQRWNYALIVLVAAHGVAYQVVEKRKAPFVVTFAAMLLVVAGLQLVGYRARRDVVRTARVRGSGTNARSMGETP